VPRASALAGAILIGLAWPGVACAQAPADAARGIRRTELQRFDVPGSPYEAVIGLIEVPPGLSIGRHAHPGIESGYMLDGEATLALDGEPDRLLKAGDAYRIPYGAVHDVRSGPGGARSVAVFVVEKEKPLASPAR
jgi:quercetin dioxygenase-like cupin family protein